MVASQGRRDREALTAALQSPAGYVGMVGSRAKIGKLLEQLAGDVPDARSACCTGPPGSNRRDRPGGDRALNPWRDRPGPPPAAAGDPTRAAARLLIS